MKHRLVLLAGMAAIVVVAAYWLLPSAPGATQPAARRASATPRGVEPSLPAVPTAVDRPRMVMTESGWRPQTNRKTPREWKDPVTGAINREILDAVPDPAAAAAEELKYRKSRLRLTLADAAAPCWSGSDSKEEIELEYTLVVEHETLRADNVRVKTSNITNPTAERCIIDAVRDLKTLADKIPDMREDGGIIMSLHDLYDRNQRDAKDRAPPSTQRDPVDLPPARPPGN
ncbi:MAG TPA: hypothetical protein VHT91_26265 [Kofleriaceae bacterium]|jgi:hypothetical protein|nr:hypothetical protein [Kofleriaceae bacterium]